MAMLRKRRAIGVVTRNRAFRVTLNNVAGRAINLGSERKVRAFFPSARILPRTTRRLTCLTILLRNFFMKSCFVMRFQVIPRRPLRAQARSITFHFRARQFVWGLGSFTRARRILMLMVMFLSHRRVIPLIRRRFLRNYPFFTPLKGPKRTASMVKCIGFNRNMTFTRNYFRSFRGCRGVNQQRNFILMRSFPFKNMTQVRFLRKEDHLTVVFPSTFFRFAFRRNTLLGMFFRPHPTSLAGLLRVNYLRIFRASVPHSLSNVRISFPPAHSSDKAKLSAIHPMSNS